MSEIKLTLTPNLDTKSKEIQEMTQPKQESAPLEPQYTQEETAMIEAFSKQIDIRDATLVFSYGAQAQQNIASFSDTALANVQTNDLGQVGEMITGLVTELRGFSVEEEEPRGFFGLFKKAGNKLSQLQARYEEAETNVNTIVEALEKHQVTLLKDISTLDMLYEENLKYFKELSMYIEAGKRCLEQVRAGDLAQVRARAQASGLPEDAQAANDLANKIDRFEKKVHDLELTRNISIQMAPQIRLIQNSNQVMAEKIQSSLVNTIPLWKSQMVLALGLGHSQSALEAQRSVTDLTNELLKRNAEALHQATTATAREAERGIVDIETLKQTNATLIQTMDEVLTIQQEGRAKRQAAEGELRMIENELKAKLLEMRN
ncbi:MAG: toxic anion resistance protein [Eubacteriales bacterium]|nr:toxic anion resistance protein [Eubacteriales bacterium]